jgi:hypothetical protein
MQSTQARVAAAANGYAPPRTSVTGTQQLQRLADLRARGHMPPGGWVWLWLDTPCARLSPEHVQIGPDEDLKALDLRGCAGLSVEVAGRDPSPWRLATLLGRLHRVPVRQLGYVELGWQVLDANGARKPLLANLVLRRL